MSDLFYKIVNGTESEQEERRSRQEQREADRAHLEAQKQEREYNERLMQYPKLIAEKRAQERFQRIAEERRATREFYSLENRLRRLWKYLWDL
jgi:hypothetical protein